jgi:hypothetical protein
MAKLDFHKTYLQQREPKLAIESVCKEENKEFRFAPKLPRKSLQYQIERIRTDTLQKRKAQF